MDPIAFNFQLHYFIELYDCHAMDAKIHNKAEQCLLRAISELEKYVGSEIIIKVEAKQEGGLKEFLNIICNSPAITAFVGVLVASFFRPAISKTEEIGNRIEIAERIKSGNFSQEEAQILLKNDKTLKNWVSEYYKSLSKEKTLTKIEASVHTDADTFSGTIERKDFKNHIVKEETLTECRIIEDATIHIVAPVLIDVHKTSWKGIYLNLPIDFKVEDNDFLRQVYNHDIKFGRGSAIICHLQIEDKTIMDDDGNKGKTKPYYTVKYVTHCEDETNFRFETDRYKKQKNLPKQLSLFDQN